MASQSTTPDLHPGFANHLVPPGLVPRSSRSSATRRTNRVAGRWYACGRGESVGLHGLRVFHWRSTCHATLPFASFLVLERPADHHLVATLLLITAAAYPPVKASRDRREQPLDERQFLLTIANARTPDFNKLALGAGVVIALAIAASLANRLLAGFASTTKVQSALPPDPASDRPVARETSSPAVPTRESDLTARARAILRSLPPSTSTNHSPAVVVPTRPLSQTDSAIAGSAILLVTLLVLYPAMQAQRMAPWRAYTETLAGTLPSAALLAFPFWLYQLCQRRRGHRVHPMLTLVVAWSLAMIASALSAR